MNAGVPRASTNTAIKSSKSFSFDEVKEFPGNKKGSKMNAGLSRGRMRALIKVNESSSKPKASTQPEMYFKH